MRSEPGRANSLAISDEITGLLTRSARLEPTHGRVTIDLDVGGHAFLRDHLVGGRPLLSTVMGIETMACAVAMTQPGRPVAAVADVEVSPPYLLPETGTGTVEVSVRPAGADVVGGADTLCCELRSRSAGGSSVLYYRAGFPQLNTRPDNPFRRIPQRQPGGPSVGAETIYRLFFHGPSFQVVRTAYYADGLMVGVLRPDLPPAVSPRRPSIMAPLLVELCLQTAGLWELAVLRSMMIPEAIHRVTRCTDVEVDDGVPLVALVSPRCGEDGRFTFDAQVVGQDGRVHLDVQGYRTTGFGHPVDGVAAGTIARALARIPAPTPY